MGSTRCPSVVHTDTCRCQVDGTALLLEDDLLATAPPVSGIVELQLVGHCDGVGLLLCEGGDSERFVAPRGHPRLEAVAVVDGQLDGAAVGGAVDGSHDELCHGYSADAEVESALALSKADARVDTRPGPEIVGLEPRVGDELLVDARRLLRVHVGHDGHQAQDRQDADDEEDHQRGHALPRSVVHGHGHRSLPGVGTADNFWRIQ